MFIICREAGPNFNYVTLQSFNCMYVLFLDPQTTVQDSWKDEYIRNYYEHFRSLVSVSPRSEKMTNESMPSSEQSKKDNEQPLLDSNSRMTSSLEETDVILKEKSALGDSETLQGDRESLVYEISSGI